MSTVTPTARVRYSAGTRHLLVLASVLALGACLPSSSEPEGVTPLEGRWDMSGQSTAGSGSTFEGTLVIRSTSAVGFSGTFDVLEATPQAAPRRLGGAVAGRMANATTSEFEVALAGITRRHVATQTADTMRGTWFDVASSGSVEASGSFRAIRAR